MKNFEMPSLYSREIHIQEMPFCRVRAPVAELSKEELCTKIKCLKQKLTNTRKENSPLRQSLVMLQGKL